MNTAKDTSLVIIGATSAIAQAVCRLHAADARHMVLCGRDPEKLKLVADDIRSRGEASVSILTVDVSTPSSYSALVEQITELAGKIDTWYFFHGSLPDQSKCEASLADTNAALQVNLLSVLDMLHPIANLLEKQRSGTIAVVSSVAGDRGRASNYIYGTAKGALSLYLQGMRNRLFNAGVNVLDIRPGFVRTPMTAHLEQKGFLWATPEIIATDIVSAVNKKSDIIYTPGYWRLIMFVIRAIPERIFKRLSL